MINAVLHQQQLYLDRVTIQSMESGPRFAGGVDATVRRRSAAPTPVPRTEQLRAFRATVDTLVR